MARKSLSIKVPVKAGKKVGIHRSYKDLNKPYIKKMKKALGLSSS